ncbi:MAG TPA: AAA family ATPase [Cyanobacteria bacterium UBA11149]|nr:AAA family ATPase [Cyanobacteria bacterium UBA11367]HBE59065.1 AAA family ATPase [Cyanobacteria bacterium UBA11366]HBK66606.1 AAA family ATPase [Cyanobacteria bacterium UBA11166]HBR72745.1 AAA family ATPase [Cyanobacteria bacterium UBA11159]HBS67922.1 AAA family ATPase [Cyanobacteria bacterium UBA11153]HBW87507.1 AAA family ATPase [Cyanobacteria bacterium UBA11149]HCA94032.1 AAA family ATPase [Cyanobacteria bacterium UBA9226]
MELPYHKCQRELQELLQAQYPLIFLRSSEESRAINCAIAAHQSLISTLEIEEGELARWNSMEGFQRRSILPEDPVKASWKRLGAAPNPKEDPLMQAINILQERLEKQATPNPNNQHTYILPDWSTLIEPNCHLTARQIKELVIAIEQKRPRPKMTLIVIGSDWSIPTILRNHVHILDLPLPIGEELYQDIFSFAISKYNISDEQARRLSEEAQGMPLQAANQTAKLITTRNLWLQPEEAGQLLLQVKTQEIRKTGVLEYYPPQGEGLQDVGGLDIIKTWIRNRRHWFEQDINPELRPRAILLEGFPGCGKSFIARAIAQEWRVPQINFEISRLQSKWVGESESNTYQALRAIEASAPNILFMDEIEKAFAGAGGDTSGVTTRQFGTFLSWLNDHKYPIFFIATSNNRNALPPELFRAGRFDETFIIMPPNTQERHEILEKKAQTYKLPPIPATTLEFLIENTAGFSGAELEKLVKETVYIAGFGYLPTETNWQEALAQIAPQYRTPRMQFLLQNYLQLLAEGGGKSASSIENNFLESLIVS